MQRVPSAPVSDLPLVASAAATPEPAGRPVTIAVPESSTVWLTSGGWILLVGYVRLRRRR